MSILGKLFGSSSPASFVAAARGARLIEVVSKTQSRVRCVTGTAFTTDYRYFLSARAWKGKFPIPLARSEMVREYDPRQPKELFELETARNNLIDTLGREMPDTELVFNPA